MKKYHRLKKLHLEPKSEKTRKGKLYIKVVLSDFMAYRMNEIFVITENEYIRDIYPDMGIVMVYSRHACYAWL